MVLNIAILRMMFLMLPYQGCCPEFGHNNEGFLHWAILRMVSIMWPYSVCNPSRFDGKYPQDIEYKKEMDNRIIRSLFKVVLPQVKRNFCGIFDRGCLDPSGRKRKCGDFREFEGCSRGDSEDWNWSGLISVVVLLSWENLNEERMACLSIKSMAHSKKLSCQLENVAILIKAPVMITDSVLNVVILRMASIIWCPGCGPIKGGVRIQIKGGVLNVAILRCCTQGGQIRYIFLNMAILRMKSIMWPDYRQHHPSRKLGPPQVFCLLVMPQLDTCRSFFFDFFFFWFCSLSCHPWETTKGNDHPQSQMEKYSGRWFGEDYIPNLSSNLEPEAKIASRGPSHRWHGPSINNLGLEICEPTNKKKCYQSPLIRSCRFLFKNWIIYYLLVSLAWLDCVVLAWSASWNIVLNVAILKMASIMMASCGHIKDGVLDVAILRVVSAAKLRVVSLMWPYEVGLFCTQGGQIRDPFLNIAILRMKSIMYITDSTQFGHIKYTFSNVATFIELNHLELRSQISLGRQEDCRENLRKSVKKKKGLGKMIKVIENELGTNLTLRKVNVESTHIECSDENYFDVSGFYFLTNSFSFQVDMSMFEHFSRNSSLLIRSHSLRLGLSALSQVPSWKESTRGLSSASVEEYVTLYTQIVRFNVEDRPPKKRHCICLEYEMVTFRTLCQCWMPGLIENQARFETAKLMSGLLIFSFLKSACSSSDASVNLRFGVRGV
ncbi:putative signal peptide protein [Puccinia sorghi]|uniref:Putative signal peptide protein n=1 Tax=Puccinia sorghi TaxID=27349 RepID=A0A0L6UVA3_9BASI|nr:putative signal peptide protein [Puccinia sorghi]